MFALNSLHVFHCCLYARLLCYKTIILVHDRSNKHAVSKVGQRLVKCIYILQKKTIKTKFSISPSFVHLSDVMRKPTMWFLNRLDTNRAVQVQKMARDWKFWIKCMEEL